jgi:hypothetical protein
MKVDSSFVLTDPDLAFSSAKTDWYALGLGMVKSIHYGGAVLPGELPHEIVETWELTDHGTLSPPPPQLLSISPSAGPVAGGTEVTLTGNFFSSGAQVTIWQFAARSVTVVSPTEIKAVTPPGFSATLDVTVVNADCQVSIKENAFTFQ